MPYSEIQFFDCMHCSNGHYDEKSACMHYSSVKISVCAIPMNVFQVYALFPFSIFLLYALFCMRYSYPLVCVKGGTPQW